MLRGRNRRESLFIVRTVIITVLGSSAVKLPRRLRVRDLVLLTIIAGVREVLGLGVGLSAGSIWAQVASGSPSLTK